MQGDSQSLDQTAQIAQQKKRILRIHCNLSLKLHDLRSTVLLIAVIRVAAMGDNVTLTVAPALISTKT
jgi:hypothetical protein